MEITTVAGRSSFDTTIPDPPGAAAERLAAWIPGQRRFTLVHRTESAARLRARSNWATWGARIDLQFLPGPDGTTSVRGRWSPVLLTTVFSWGQGQRDLRTIAAELGTDPDARPQGR